MNEINSVKWFRIYKKRKPDIINLEPKNLKEVFSYE